MEKSKDFSLMRMGEAQYSLRDMPHQIHSVHHLFLVVVMVVMVVVVVEILLVLPLAPHLSDRGRGLQRALSTPSARLHLLVQGLMIV